MLLTSRKYCRLEFIQISPNRLAVKFNCFSKAVWEQQTAIIKLHEDYRRLFKKLKNQCLLIKTDLAFKTKQHIL
jgi:hypothetical protein